MSVNASVDFQTFPVYHVCAATAVEVFGMKMKRSLAFVSAAAILLTVGCGGGGSSDNTPTASGNANFTGSETGTGTTGKAVGVPSTGGVTTKLSDGTSVVIPSGVLPGGTSVSGTTDLAIIPAGVGFSGSFASGTAITIGQVSGTGVVSGEVANSGATVGTDGLLTVTAALPVTDPVNGTEYELGFPEGDLDTRALTVKRFRLRGRFYLRTISGKKTIISPIPTALSGKLPNNGENAVGSTMTATFGAGNEGRVATLRIQYTKGAGSFILSDTKTISLVGGKPKVTFSDIAKDAKNVPATGVWEVRLTLGPLP